MPSTISGPFGNTGLAGLSGIGLGGLELCGFGDSEQQRKILEVCFATISTLYIILISNNCIYLIPLCTSTDIIDNIQLANVYQVTTLLTSRIKLTSFFIVLKGLV